MTRQSNSLSIGNNRHTDFVASPTSATSSPANANANANKNKNTAERSCSRRNIILSACVCIALLSTMAQFGSVQQFSAFISSALDEAPLSFTAAAATTAGSRKTSNLSLLSSMATVDLSTTIISTEQVPTLWETNNDGDAKDDGDNEIDNDEDEGSNDGDNSNGDENDENDNDDDDENNSDNNEGSNDGDDNDDDDKNNSDNNEGSNDGDGDENDNNDDDDKNDEDDDEHQSTSATSVEDQSSRNSKRTDSSPPFSLDLPVRAYAFDPNDDDTYDPDDLSKLPIRSWGCQRREEAPFIFVHIGKAGGGSVRARLAASALDYNRTSWNSPSHDKSYYYPMVERRIVAQQDGHEEQRETVVKKTRRGIFINSQFHNFRPSFPRTSDNFTKEDMEVSDKVWKTYEKTLPCSATTPLGQAIACPLATQQSRAAKEACAGTRCHIVYVGHNLLGNEMHWLPTQYLTSWWRTTPWGRRELRSLRKNTTNVNAIARQEDKKKPVTLLWRDRHRRWRLANSPCHARRRQTFSFYRQHYFECVAPHEDNIDQAASVALSSTIPHNKEEAGTNDGATTTKVTDWSPIYASLPVLRVTMMREPFSWLVSKFFWHRGSISLLGRNGTFVKLITCDMNGTDFDTIADWVGPAVLKQINHLCGEDCLVRQEMGEMTLEETERQARHNLQHSFAVVGLLNETQTFYDMITARAAYMNTTLNPDVRGSKHSTSKAGEYQRCSQIYQSPDFQEKLVAVCPEVGALQRLWNVAVQVNRFQLQEMQSCGLLNA